MQSTPFISTTPLDILAGIFCLFTLLSCIFVFSLVCAIVGTVFDIDLYCDYNGYDIAILKPATLRRGYGVTFSRGIKIWRFIDNGAEGKIEIRLFPS